MTRGAVIFDLDGTLVDTAPDLVAVLNRLLLDSGRPRVPYAIARNEASNGAAGLLRLGLGPGAAADEVDRLRPRFLEIYAAHIAARSRLFIGLNDIDELSSRFELGIVTNKPDAFTRPLLAALDLARRFACVVSGDRLPQRQLVHGELAGSARRGEHGRLQPSAQRRRGLHGQRQLGDRGDGGRQRLADAEGRP